MESELRSRKIGKDQLMETKPSIEEKEERETKPIDNPKTTHFEFMGPHGTLAILIGTPFIVFFLYSACDPLYGCPPTTNDQWMNAYLKMASLRWENQDAYTIVLSWLAFHGAFQMVGPGRWAKGTTLRTGEKLDYRINGLLSLVPIIAFLSISFFIHGVEYFIWIADHFHQLMAAAAVISLSLALYLYISSFRINEPVLLAEGGNSGYPVYDFFMGRELNPRWFEGTLDLKYVCELRPGLIGWAILNFCFAVKQYTQIGYVTNGMIAINLFQGYYVFDALWNEEAILTTMDIKTDGFGFMLAFGDLVWVPFTYSLQARYQSLFPQQLSLPYLLSLLLINFAGLLIFRLSNGEKNAFRSNPNHPSVSHLKYIETKSGSKLLVSGWWGAARKINYTGDWIMALTWSLACGSSSPLVFFYPIYFAGLLIHRAQRDELICSKKYGADWEVYKKRVPYRFVPGIW